ncbi:MAG: TVP38/TMEM64 family protein [bacterium]|nr:MAG: TVP38/TMEM64 family protein [bacterium]
MTGVVVILAALLLAFRYYNVQDLLIRSLEWIQGQGASGAVVFVVIYILATVFFLPGSLLTLGAGFVYGLVKGFIIVSVASTLGATCAFLVGRYLARNWVARKVEGSPRFKAIDEAVAEAGWKIVGLTRLSPVFPFNMLNYAYGLTKVSLRHYFFASWIGMMPGTVMYVYFGTVAGSLATLGTGSRPQTKGELTVKVVGLLATIIVTVYITRIARRALAGRVEGLQDPGVGGKGRVQGEQ